MTRSTVPRVHCGLAVICLLVACCALAEPTSYVKRAAFDNALDDIDADRLIVNFDELGETPLPSGSEVDNIIFVYDFMGVELEVRKIDDQGDFDTTSQPFFLASTDAGVLQDGDDITFQFPVALHGFGLYIMTSDAVVDNDLFLSVDGFNAKLEATELEGVLSDGADVYFLGIVDPTQKFTTATLGTNGAGVFLYSLDDLEIAVAPDSDGDGVANAIDNCSQRSNSSQLDSDGDNIGNACDADIGLPNDCTVNVIDLGVLRAAFFGTPSTANWNPDADFNGDGVVNIQDLGVLRQLFFGVPGPSALPNACAP
ncbi:MAG: hypothetical protein AAF610_15625 [Pseudomonadota bacterium]